jgi:hypothetical protein
MEEDFGYELKHQYQFLLHADWNSDQLLEFLRQILHGNHLCVD